jgi:hypothetical protein
MLTRPITPRVAVLVLLAGPWCVPAFAQPPTAGVVVDTTNTPVAAVTLVVTHAAGRTHRTQTDADGRFVFDDVASGQARLTTEADGREPLTMDVRVPTRQDGLRLVLQPAGLLETVVVIGEVGARRSLHPERRSSLARSMSWVPTRLSARMWTCRTNC